MNSGISEAIAVSLQANADMPLRLSQAFDYAGTAAARNLAVLENADYGIGKVDICPCMW